MEGEAHSQATLRPIDSNVSLLKCIRQDTGQVARCTRSVGTYVVMSRRDHHTLSEFVRISAHSTLLFVVR